MYAEIAWVLGSIIGNYLYVPYDYDHTKHHPANISFEVIAYVMKSLFTFDLLFLKFVHVSSKFSKRTRMIRMLD